MHKLRYEKDWTEQKRLKKQAKGLIKNYSGFPVSVKALEELVETLEDFLTNKEKSQYYKEYQPCRIQMEGDEDRQARSKTLSNGNYKKTYNSVVSTGKVTSPVWASERVSINTDYDAGLSNGTHRVTVGDEGVKKGALTRDFHIPAFQTSKNLDQRLQLNGVKLLLQQSLNDHEPREASSKKDISKLVRKLMAEQIGELSIKNIVRTVTANSFTDKQIDSIINRVIKSNAKASSDTLEHPSCMSVYKQYTETFEVYRGDGTRAEKAKDVKPEKNRKTDKPVFHTNHTINKNEKIFISAVTEEGSSFDQLYTRDIKRYASKSSNERIMHLWNCKDTKGEAQTVINKRIAYFADLRELYRDTKLLTGGKEGVLPVDYVIVLPQIKHSCDIEIDEVRYKIAGETGVNSRNNRKRVIPRQDILDWITGKPNSKTIEDFVFFDVLQVGENISKIA